MWRRLHTRLRSDIGVSQKSSDTCAPQHGSATLAFGTIARLRQALDELVHLSQYLGLVRLENIMTRILQQNHAGRRHTRVKCRRLIALHLVLASTAPRAGEPSGPLTASRAWTASAGTRMSVYRCDPLIIAATIGGIGGRACWVEAGGCGGAFLNRSSICRNVLSKFGRSVSNSSSIKLLGSCGLLPGSNSSNFLPLLTGDPQVAVATRNDDSRKIYYTR